MLLIKKNYISYLYIFFLILVIFFSEFSTNRAISKNYIVSDIKVEKVYDLNFKKSDVIDEAFNQAFRILTYKLIENKDKSKIENISLEDKKRKGVKAQCSIHSIPDKTPKWSVYILIVFNSD